MKRMSVYALKTHRKAILELLQRKGVLEIDTPKKAQPLFEKTDTGSARQTFEKNVRTLTQAAALLDSVSPPAKGLPAVLRGREPITGERYRQTVDAAGDTARLASRILALGKRMDDGKAEAQRCAAGLEALEPWLPLDISMRSIGTEKTSVFIGSFPEALTAG